MRRLIYSLAIMSAFVMISSAKANDVYITQSGANLNANINQDGTGNKVGTSGAKVTLDGDAHTLDIDQIGKALQIGADAIEIHTGKFCNMQNDADALNELINIKKAAKYAKSIGLEVHAGHGLTFNNVFEIAKIIEINEEMW